MFFWIEINSSDDKSFIFALSTSSCNVLILKLSQFSSKQYFKRCGNLNFPTDKSNPKKNSDNDGLLIINSSALSTGSKRFWPI